MAGPFVYKVTLLGRAFMLVSTYLLRSLTSFNRIPWLHRLCWHIWTRRRRFLALIVVVLGTHTFFWLPLIRCICRSGLRRFRLIFLTLLWLRVLWCNISQTTFQESNASVYKDCWISGWTGSFRSPITRNAVVKTVMRFPIGLDLHIAHQIT